MRTSSARTTGGSATAVSTAADQWSLRRDIALRGRQTLFVVLATLLLAAAGIVFTPGGAARADTPFLSGQVFASVGFSTVNVYGSGSSTPSSSLVDSTGEPFTTGSAFDANDNFYVTDDTSGDISEFSSTGTPMGQFATGLQNPESLVFDNSGNLYVGQQTTPYVAEFTPSGQRLPDIGPLQTELYGADWIDLSSDQCTLYYTTEGTDILRYNKCTNTQLPNFNLSPFTGLGAFEVRILADGDVLVADSNAVLLLDQNGNVIQTYSCASLPGCQGLLFAVSVDPDGTSFWTGDSFSGNIWQVDLATGQVLQTIDATTAYLYGLSVNGQLMAATSPTVVSATPTTLTVNPTSGDFSSPTPVSAVLTDSSTDTPISDEPVTFTLNGSETCTGTTDDTGTATCVITPTEPSQSYTLSATFPGDSSTSTPIGSDSTSSTFEVSPDTSSVTFTGPTTAVNGQPTTLSGTLTTDVPAPDTPLGSQVVTFTLGSGPTAQTCSGTTDDFGNVDCAISPVDQPVSDVPVTTSYSGGSYEAPATVSTPVTVTEPTTLTVHSATGDYADATTVSGVLTDSVTNQPIGGEQVSLSLNGNESCSATTSATGTASCSITPGEPAATYPLTGNFAGDAAQALQLMPSNGSSNFVVTLEETALTYTGPSIAHDGQPLPLSGVLTTDDPGLGTPIAGRAVTFVLGSGPSAQTCAAVTDATGTAACTIASVSQAPGPIPVTDTFGGDPDYQTASASSTVNLPEETQLTVNPTTGVYDGSTPVTGTLVNTYTNQPVPGEPVTLTVNGAQTCTATTDANGVATCAVTPTEPSGTYSLSGSFPGDTATGPQLLPSDATTTFTVTPAPTTVTYTGPTTVTNGQPTTLSGVLTTSEPTPGTDVAGSTVTFTIGSGGSAQSCTGTTDANGHASCTVPSVTQSSGTVVVTTTYGGDNTYYQPSTTSTTATVLTPTRLTVGAGTSDFADAYTVSATLTAYNGAVVAGEPVTLTLNGSQSCTGITNAKGVASCTITPNEPAGTYTLTATFGGDTSRAPQLLSSTGSNSFVVTLEETAITYTGGSLAVNGMPFTMSAHLTTDDPTAATALGGRAVLMTLGTGTTAQTCTGVTNALGNASCTLASVSSQQIAGSAPVSVRFAGDPYYRPAGASSTVTTASPPSGGGGFLVGDVSAAPSAATVNFWGSQLWKQNVFSGVNNSPASMKGYIDNVPSYACGANWTSDPGNSSGPPSTVPVNMVVVVSTSTYQSGSTEYGNIKHLVVVHVAPGYGPAPGHDGYGQIIATIC